jgi:hypothetical protein
MQNCIVSRMLRTKNMNTPKVQMKNTPMETVQIQLAHLTNPNNKIKYQIQMTAKFSYKWQI